MRTIWKFPLRELGVNILSMPNVHKFLTVQLQERIPTLWAEVNSSAPTQEVAIYGYPTGGEAPGPDEQYIGTVQLDGFVWHYFAKDLD
jgi:hypothetical protein